MILPKVRSDENIVTAQTPNFFFIFLFFSSLECAILSGSSARPPAAPQKRARNRHILRTSHEFCTFNNKNKKKKYPPHTHSISPKLPPLPEVTSLISPTNTRHIVHTFLFISVHNKVLVSKVVWGLRRPVRITRSPLTCVHNNKQATCRHAKIMHESGNSWTFVQHA